MAPTGIEYELILVDDGSSDRSFEIMERLAHDDRRVRVVKLRRNFGQTPAMAAGIDFAHGDILVTLDGDLQNDPTDIPAMLAKMEEGYDMVAGWRRNRQDKAMTRVLPSKIANALISKLMGVSINDTGCTLKAFRAKAIKGVPLYSDMHRFIPAMTSLVGARMVEMEVKHHPRRFGKSKYGLSRIYRVLVDLVILRVVLSFARQPVSWCAFFASITGAVTLLFAAMFFFGFLTLQPVLSMSLALIFGAATFYFVFLGMIAHLIYGRMMRKRDQFIDRAAKAMATVFADSTETAR
jgi:glycosyltransferase involved in cell wall biosynthesis